MSRRSRRSVLQLAGAGLAALLLPSRAEAEVDAGPVGGPAVPSPSVSASTGTSTSTSTSTGTGDPAPAPASDAGAGAFTDSVADAGADAGPAAVAEEEPRPSLFSGAPEPDDPLELLYSRRLSFDDGQPLVTVRVLEGRESASLRALGPLAAWARSAEGKPEPVFKPPVLKALKAPPKAVAKGRPLAGKPLAGKLASKREAAHKAAKAPARPPPSPAWGTGPAGKWRIELQGGQAPIGATWVELEQVRYADKEGREAARALWESRGVRVRLATVGDVYGIAGHVVDTRRWSLLAEGDATAEGAAQQARALGDKWGIRPQLHRELASRPQGVLQLIDPKGKVVAEGHGALELRCGQGLAVEQVEFGMGYAFHAFERRLYPGRLFACVDAEGKLALVAALPMERLVKGVVPSEIFARAHPEALKAQAVTARGEVLAKVGARHLGDPYLLCAEQHCQVYKGLAAELPSTDRAVDATRGQALFSQPPSQPQSQPHGDAPRRLVDSVYSAVCGGFTEDNDAVWGGPADPSLRGRPDFPLDNREVALFKDGIGEALVGRFVGKNPVPSYCALSGFAPKDKVRWKKYFTWSETDALCAAFDIGSVQAMTVEGRGVSGRARALRLEGTKGITRVLGELNIRKLFKMLPSGMFVVEREEGRWSFTGGGWGHGSGMCQTGAIGRALRGASYRQILGWYYSGASPEKVY